MAKRIFSALLCLMLLAACHSSKTQHAAQTAAELSAAPQKSVSVQNPGPIQEPEQTPDEQPAVPDADEKPAPAQTATVPAESKSQSQTPHQTPPNEPQNPAAEVPIPFTPAPDEAVFEDEKLIDFEGRMLHPYAELVPDATAEQNAPWAYEQLKYGVYYTFIKAGTAYIRNRGLVHINGRPAYLLQTTAFSAPVIDAFFKVRDVNQSWLDAQDFYSLGYGQSVREGGYRRDEWVTFDYENGRYEGKIQKKEEPRDIAGPLDITVLDILTSLYHVRGQELVPGQDIVFDIINREKQYPLVVKVLKKEEVKTDAGTFDCVLVEPQLRGEGIFVSKGKSLKVWLTDDEYKMPVKMQVEVFIGSVSAKLLEYKRQEPENIL